MNTLYNALADHPDIRKVDFSSCCSASPAAWPCSRRSPRKWRQLTGKAIIEGYGLSETSPVLCANRLDLEEFTGTVGFPLPSTDISIRDADGNDGPAWAKPAKSARAGRR